MTTSEFPAKTQRIIQTSCGDRVHINVGDKNDLSYWSTKLVCSPDQIRTAVEQVGNKVADVRHFVWKTRGGK